MDNDTKVILVAFAFLILGLGMAIGVTVEKNRLEGFTLIENKSNDWYWLEGKEYREADLNELYTLKNILISNECSDGGFIENLDGNEFLIICYEAKKVIKHE